jgi:hypothetical protein
LLATSAGQLGDIVVNFFRTQDHYLLRELKVDPPRYRFLGPCVFKGQCAAFYHPYFGSYSLAPEETLSKSASLVASVKNKLHRDCWKALSDMEMEEFVII